ncbi:MAG: hypothetical protein K0B81_08860 [Candidatus Cloacimonetes bacterium]|nr:hypothetical protein [Candidatus Cloacimonadota bacterium]
MNKSLPLTIALIFLFFTCSSILNSQALPNQIRDLIVEDIQDDDGTGLILSWTPLSRESRVIEYRIYRGVSPDSLFLIGLIEVDPTLGVTSPRMYYYDRDFTDFVSLYSPSRLRKESQQPPDSPLYRQMPRDINIYGQYLNHYSVLGVINKDDFYYRSKLIENIETDEEGNEDRTVYAGLPLRSFDGLYSMLVPEKPYYYSVLAVDYQRRFFPPSDIVMGIAYDNSPELPSDFSAVILSDIHRIQFEWLNPSFEDDIYHRNVYLLTEAQINAMQTYIRQEIAREEIILQRKKNPDLDIPDIQTDYQNPALHIFADPTAFPYASTTIGFVQSNNGLIHVIGSETEYAMDWNNLEKYRLVFSFSDYAGFENFSEIIEPRIMLSDEKPTLPVYSIIDKPDDKGDYNQLLFGKPLIFLTQGSFLNPQRNRLALNYDFTDNRLNSLSSVNFKIYDSQGTLLDEINEFLPDKIIRFNIPSFDTIVDGLYFEMIPEIKSKELIEPYVLAQTSNYNEEFGLIEFGELIIIDSPSIEGDESEVVSDYSYYLLKRAKSDRYFRLARNISPFARSFDDSIPYETSIFKLVNKYELDNKLLLVDNSLAITYDDEREIDIVTNIFAGEIENDLNFYRQKISEYEKQLAKTTDMNEYEMLDYYLEYYKNRLWMETEHPILVEANQIENNRRRIKYIANIRERHRRSFQYIFVKSDRNGLFYQDDIYEVDGETYFFPTPDWFSSDQFPALIASLIFGFLVFYLIRQAMKGKDMYIRPIAGLEEIDNAIGRATEMGKPILFVPGIGYIEDIATLAGLSILSNVARKAAEYDTRVMVPVADYIVLPIAMETVKEAHIAAGRPDTFNREDIFYISGDQFAFVAGVNGIMVRQKTVANFFLGVFFAEALIMTETGNAQGAIQIAGSDSITQIPFFITTCDYTLIGEELYGASAYLAREPMMMGTLKAQDYTKFLILSFIIIGAILSTIRVTFLINAFPSQ